MHIGLILDGNRRWAKNRGIPVAVGHKKGIENFEEISRCVLKRGDIHTLSVFALSTENLQRNNDELKNLFHILKKYAEKNISEFQKEGIAVRFMGNISLLPEFLRYSFQRMEQETKEGMTLSLNICVAYGGRDEIIRAAKKLSDAKEDWNEKNFEQHLDFFKSPNIDLLIRTGGKFRISNFMLWEAAYTELFFSEKMWPEFSEHDLKEAIGFYKKQKRTFGK